MVFWSLLPGIATKSRRKDDWQFKFMWVSRQTSQAGKIGMEPVMQAWNAIVRRSRRTPWLDNSKKSCAVIMKNKNQLDGSIPGWIKKELPNNEHNASFTTRRGFLLLLHSKSWNSFTFRGQRSRRRYGVGAAGSALDERPVRQDARKADILGFCSCEGLYAHWRYHVGLRRVLQFLRDFIDLVIFLRLPENSTKNAL